MYERDNSTPIHRKMFLRRTSFVGIRAIQAGSATAVVRSLRRPLSTVRLGQFVDVLPEVRDALRRDGAVVALESTIITHGMPFPHNLETARHVERVVREQVRVHMCRAYTYDKTNIPYMYSFNDPPTERHSSHYCHN